MSEKKRRKEGEERGGCKERDDGVHVQMQVCQYGQRRASTNKNNIKIKTVGHIQTQRTTIRILNTHRTHVYKM